MIKVALVALNYHEVKKLVMDGDHSQKETMNKEASLLPATNAQRRIVEQYVPLLTGKKIII